VLMLLRGQNQRVQRDQEQRRQDSRLHPWTEGRSYFLDGVAKRTWLHSSPAALWAWACCCALAAVLRSLAQEARWCLALLVASPATAWRRCWYRHLLLLQSAVDRRRGPSWDQWAAVPQWVGVARPSYRRPAP
jgi:hypothetical protein